MEIAKSPVGRKLKELTAAYEIRPQEFAEMPEWEQAFWLHEYEHEDHQ